MSNLTAQDKDFYNKAYQSVKTFDTQCFAFLPHYPYFARFVKEGLGHDVELGDLRIIDMGCGIGRLLVELQRQGFRGQQVGVDWPEAARIAFKELMSQEATPDMQSKTQFIELDVTKPAQLNLISPQRLDGNKLDIITSSRVLSTLPNQVQILNNWAKLLTASGRIIVDWSITEPEDAVQNDYIESIDFDVSPDRQVYSPKLNTCSRIQFAAPEAWQHCEAAFRKLVQQTDLEVVRIKHVRFAREGAKTTSLVPQMRAEAEHALKQSKPAFRVMPAEYHEWKEHTTVPFSLLNRVTGGQIQQVYAELNRMAREDERSTLSLHRQVGHCNVMVLAELKKKA